jgi:hypothetical protein
MDEALERLAEAPRLKIEGALLLRREEWEDDGRWWCRSLEE